MYKKWSSKYLIYLTCYLCSILFFVSFFVADMQKVLAYTTIFLSIYLCYYVRKNILLLFISGIIFLTNYSLCFVNYLSYVPISFYTDFYNQNVSVTGLQIILLFLISLMVVLPKKICIIDKSFNAIFPLSNKNNYYLGLIFISLIVIFFVGFPSAKLGERTIETPIYMYSVILFIIGLMLCNNSRFWKLIFACLLLSYSVNNIIFGGRTTAIELMIIFMFFYFKIDFKIKYIFLFFLFYFLFSLVGSVRAHLLNITLDTIYNSFNELLRQGFAVDTFYSAYYSSLTFVKYMSDVTFDYRLTMMGYYVLYIFLGGNLVPEANLSIISQQYYYQQGGGILPFYGFFWLGWLGVILLGLLVGGYFTIISRSIQNSSVYEKGISLYVTATVTSWYVYAPAPLFRGVFLFTVLFYFIKFTSHNKYSIKNIKKLRIR